MTWSLLSDMPLYSGTDFQYPAGGMATDGTLIYIITHRYPGSRLIKYNPGTDTYTDISATTHDGGGDDPIEGLSWIEAGGAGDGLVSLGSNFADGPFTDLYGSPISSGSWTSGAVDPFGRRSYGAAGGKGPIGYIDSFARDSGSWTASSPNTTNSSQFPSLAIDGDDGTTFWQPISATVTPTLVVDRGASAYPITFVRIKSHGTLGPSTFYPIDYTIETSTDNSSWTTRATVTGNSSLDRTDTFASTSDRYVRIVVTSRQSDGGDSYAHLALLEFTPGYALGVTESTYGAPAGTWVEQSGTWRIFDGEVVETTGGGGQFTAVVDTGFSDGVVEVTFPDFQDGGLSWRASDANNYWLCNNTFIYKCVGGGFTAVGANFGTALGRGIAGGDRVRVVVNGNVHDFYVQLGGTGDYILASTVTDAFNNTATKHGLRSDATFAYDDRFRDFKAYQDKIILAGGYDYFGDPISDVTYYNYHDDSWTTLASMPAALAETAGAWSGTNFYVFGGYNGTSYTPTGYKYNSLTNTWSTLTVPFAASQAGIPGVVTLDDGTIYVFGGFGTTGSSATWIYDPVGDSWTAHEPLPFASNATGVAIGHTVYAWDIWLSENGNMAYSNLIAPFAQAEPDVATGVGSAYDATRGRVPGDCRWTLYDPETGITWSFLINPNAGGSPAYQKSVISRPTTAIDGKPLIFEGSDVPQAIQFGGVLLEEEHLNVFQEWYDKRHQIVMTDDLDREFTIYITEFDLKRKRAVQYPFKHEYTAKAIVLDWPA